MPKVWSRNTLWHAPGMLPSDLSVEGSWWKLNLFSRGSADICTVSLLTWTVWFGPQVFREDSIISGYRHPRSSALDCVLSSFQMNNETINIWTHFLPTWCAQQHVDLFIFFNLSHAHLSCLFGLIHLCNVLPLPCCTRTSNMRQCPQDKHSLLCATWFKNIFFI